MLYPNLHFPKIKNKPFFYTNFVSTVDGKVQVVNDPFAYWPIGSKEDYEVLIELRAYADVLIHGKNTANWFKHAENLEKKEFIRLRKKLYKDQPLFYMVISNHPDDKLIENIAGKNTFLVTSEESSIKNEWLKKVNVLKFGKKQVNLNLLSSFLYKKGHKNVLVEGGPMLLGSFLKEDLIDEVFLTITPKIFGSEKNQTLTMVEGHLFSANKIKNLQLVSVKKIKDEVFLRYKVLASQGQALRG